MNPPNGDARQGDGVRPAADVNAGRDAAADDTSGTARGTAAATTAPAGTGDSEGVPSATRAHPFAPDQPVVDVGFFVPSQRRRYKAGNLPLARGDRIVVEGERGLEIGHVLRGRDRVPAGESARKVVRAATPGDERVEQTNAARTREALQFCEQAIRQAKLPMKLVHAEFAHSGNRAIFFFTSADRVDFRGLIKDLAQRFHTRIEMRQLGVRDASSHAGGLGLCGRMLCCNTWLPAFKPISIRMAKDQNLALNHDKLSGVCGRLRCCLEYEAAVYKDERKGLPKLGKRVMTPMGEGRVKDINVLRRRIRVELSEGGYAEFADTEVEKLGAPQQPSQQQPQPPPPAHPGRSGAGDNRRGNMAGDEQEPQDDNEPHDNESHDNESHDNESHDDESHDDETGDTHESSRAAADGTRPTSASLPPQEEGRPPGTRRRRRRRRRRGKRGPEGGEASGGGQPHGGLPTGC